MSIPKRRKEAKANREAKAIEVAIEADQWDLARRLIRKKLEKEPDSHFWLTRLGLTYYEQKQYKRALHYSIMALQSEPYCPLAIWDYAGTLDMLGRDKEALHVYRWLITFGEDRLAFGPCGEGIRSARSLIADCHYRIARIWEDKRQRKKALAAYKTHLAFRKPGVRSIYPLSEVRRRQRELSQSR